MSGHKGHLLLTLVGVSDYTEVEAIAIAIFTECWSSSISDVYLIAQTTHRAARLYTFSPYDGRNCDLMKSMTINEFSANDFTPELTVNNDKLKNMHKCNLTVVIPLNTNMVNIRTNENGEQYLGGIEGNIINFLAHATNFTVDIIKLQEKNMRSTIVEMVNVSYMSY